MRMPEPMYVRVELHAFKTENCAVPASLLLRPDDMVIIHDDGGEDLGRVLNFADTDEAEAIVVRHATEEDRAGQDELAEKTRRVLELFRRQTTEFGLRMKVVDAHWRWDRKKVCFYFISEQRLDFRALHKVISSALNIRVAIKQVGVRDHARIIGGLGACGRELCCRTHMTELTPVTLRMARLQNLFVEPAKISGVCGKLLCCLRFEAETYRQALEELPRVGARVRTGRGPGRVTDVNVPARKVTVRYDDDGEQVIALEEISEISNEDEKHEA